MTTNLEKHTTKNPIGKFFLNNFLNTVIATIKPLGVQSVLDVGCGEGFTLDRLHKEKIGKRLEGVDAVKEAVVIGQEIHPHLALKIGDVFKLNYENNSFDIVLCTEVLEHLDRPKEALEELIHVSKKYVLVTVPNEPWFTVQRFLRGKNILKFGDHPEHIRHWSSSSFERFVKRVNGVRIIRKKHPFPWTMLLLQKAIK